jgi:hypothetical protein
MNAASRRQRAAPADYPSRIRWLARLAVLTLALQLGSLGHWSVGPFHAGAAGLETHSAHCHGDTSACGGQPAFTGTYIERPLTVTISTLRIEVEPAAEVAPAGVAPAMPERPPKAA